MVCQMYRSAPFAATDRSYRHTAGHLWEWALPAKRTPQSVRCTAALLSRPRTAPTDTLQVTRGSGLCPRRGRRGLSDVPQRLFRGHGPLLQTHCRSPVGAGSAREEGAAVCQMYRSASFAATDRSHRHIAGHLWERALPAKRTPWCVRCTAAPLSRPRTAPTDTLQVTCGSGLCPRRGRRGVSDVPQRPVLGHGPLLQTHCRSPVGAGSAREEDAAILRAA